MGWTTPKIQTISFSTVDFVTVFGFSASHMHQWFWVCGSFFFRKKNVCQIRCIYFKLPQKPPKSCKFRSTNCLCMSLRLLPHICQLCTLEVLVSSLPSSPIMGGSWAKGQLHETFIFPTSAPSMYKGRYWQREQLLTYRRKQHSFIPEFLTETHSQFAEIIQVKNQ